MQKYFTTVAIALFFLCIGVSPLFSDDKVGVINDILVTRDDEKTGKSIFTVRMRPDKSMVFDKIDYEIIYHQDFPFEDSRGNKYHRVHEPVVFKYSAKNIKMVADLDLYVNFRVPFSRKRLKIIYGKKTFHPNYPITIPRIKISAYTKNKIVFTCTVDVGKLYIRDIKTGKLVKQSGKEKKATPQN